jgi:manganese/iron transport system permease protein/iron/zinc/copper transport system permease protein
MIVFAGTVQFFVVLFVAPRYGIMADWLRRRAMVPQSLVEDVVGCFRKAEGKPIDIATVNKYVDAKPEQIRRAIRWLETREWLESNGEMLSLTEEGQAEARRLLRAHRLWETYLEHVGMPTEELHERAHVLEHMHDENTVDYLDDKLGHPLRDPHGAEIPEDPAKILPGTSVKLAMLRDGHQGTIESIEGKLTGPKLIVGGHIAIGPRKENGTVWTMRLADGRWIELDHSAADSVVVKLDS